MLLNLSTKKTMKVVLTTFNAKYIHTSLALRWLYVVNKENHDISFEEFTIKELPEVVAETIVAQNPDVVGISVYIWNVELSGELAHHIKKRNPNIKIIIGGPEVSYEQKYFLDNWVIDYVISGEGEFVLGELLNALENELSTEIKSVSSKEKISHIPARANLEELVKFPSPYTLKEDEKNLKNRIIYFETSRGCPYQCQYCLSSLEKGVRYFPQDYIEESLKYFINSKAKTIKFLDRTFNLNKKHTDFIFDFLLKNYRPNLSIQFEIYADLLNEESINYLNTNVPKDYFRFEIGIQSTYEPSNLAVKRKQDFQLIANNVRQLMDGDVIDLHLDLIAGLPLEGYDRFVQSFNDVFHLKAKELQLGFLKMLRGTALRRNAFLHKYIYDENAPYEVTSNKYISKEELDKIRDVEYSLDRFWNSGRFVRTMERLINNEYKLKYFQLFDEIAQFYNDNELRRRGYSLEELFANFNGFLETKNIDASDTLRDDFYSNFAIRPHSYWRTEIEKQERKRLIYTIGQDREFLEKHNLTRRIIEKQTTINPLSEKKYLLTIFSGKKEDELFQIEYEF